MRLPIEGDLKPHGSKGATEEADYDTHVRALADRLREANNAAGHQTTISHETAKRYYDRHTKLNHYNNGDIVNIHDPMYKRGKAKKFSYQYKGPFEIEQKVSPLIYKVRLTDGTSAVIHTNRLKQAYGKMNKISPKDKRDKGDQVKVNEIC
jgi:hypothetical protein